MQKQKFEPNAYTVSLMSGRHLVHGQDHGGEFSDTVQALIMSELSRSSKEVMEQFSGLTVAQPAFEVKDIECSDIISTLRQWQEVLEQREPPKEFTPCSIPDWLRPGLIAKGMTDCEIDRLVVTHMGPMLENGPGIVFNTEMV